MNIVAIADTNELALQELADIFHADVYNEYETFLKANNIDLVYIATPPFLHYHQSKLALLAGKHVICEKPAALHASEAEELASIAAGNKLLYVVNLMQRYNSLYKIVGEIIDQKILGSFLHGFFENYASDENLNEDHWFWKEDKSGGIFIEHGVHFFDLFSGWLGEGKVECAFQLQRKGFEGMVDRVQATVRYSEGLVNFYHGFDQPKILDRQELRLLFERGEITLYEWIPVKMKLHALLQNKQIDHLREIMGDFEMTTHDDYPNRKVRGKFREINYDKHVTIEYGNIAEKQNRYAEMLTAMIEDQYKWIQDRRHKRVIDDTNAINSLKMAEEATKMAGTF